jgi:signal transduction histidine kinase
MDPTRTQLADELSALLEIGTTLLETLDVERVLAVICDHARNLLDAEGSAVSQYDEKTDEFVIRQGSGTLESAVGSRFPAEGSLSGRALESRKPVLEDDVPASSARDAADSLSVEIHRALVAPLIGRGRVLGTLSCIKGSSEPPFSPEELRILLAFANQAALAVLNAQGYQDELKRAEALDLLHDRLEEQVRQLHSLHSAGITVTSDLDLEVLLERVVEEGRRLTRARYGALGVLSEDGDSLDRFITVGITDEERARMGPPPTGKGLLGAVTREGRPIRVKSARSDSRSVGVPKSHPPVGSFVGVPIRIRDRVFGNLYLTNKEGHSEFTEEDQAVLEMLAAYAAVAIENARLFEQRARLIDELESAQRSRNRLHAYVNHDIRNALHGVSLWAERLMRRVDRVGSADGRGGEETLGEQAEIARKIQRGSDHALRLVTDVLDLARIEQGRFNTWPRKINLADLVTAARDTLAPEAEIREVRLAAPEVQPGLRVVSDPDRVLQITLNLLSNAVKFSPPGSEVSIAVRASDSLEGDAGPGSVPERGDAGGDGDQTGPAGGEDTQPPAEERAWVVVSVTDQGPGIHREDLDRIFSEFEQLDSAEMKRGSGLGLTLCRTLAHHLGGTIQVHSVVGTGSTFSLSLPAEGEYQGREGWIG